MKLNSFPSQMSGIGRLLLAIDKALTNEQNNFGTNSKKVIKLAIHLTNIISTNQRTKGWILTQAPS